MSPPQTKFTEISALPRLLVDRIEATPGTGRTACSILRVTAMTISSAGRSPASTLMAIRGKLTRGNKETGKRNAVITPAAAKNRNNTRMERRCRAAQCAISIYLPSRTGMPSTSS